MMYEIYVFGQELEGVESVGGWQLYYRGSDKNHACIMREHLFATLGEENVNADF